jgi:hypothetical protein
VAKADFRKSLRVKGDDLVLLVVVNAEELLNAKQRHPIVNSRAHGALRPLPLLLLIMVVRV